MSPRVRRIARRTYKCEDGISRYCSPIEKGHAYLSTTLFPGTSEYARSFGRPVRLKSCAYCAAAREEDIILEPMPVSQKFRYWEADSEALERRRDSEQSRRLLTSVR